MRRVDHAAPGPDRHRYVVGVGRRRAEQEDGPRRRLLDRLEQGVAGLLGEPVGVLDEHDLPPAAGGCAGRPQHQRPHLVDRDGQSLGDDRPDVGVGTGERGVALGAHAAPTLRALQRGGEGPRGDRPTRARRSGEEPRVGHRPGRCGSPRTIAPAARAAPTSSATASSWPTSDAKTGGALDGGRTHRCRSALSAGWSVLGAAGPFAT